MKYRNPSVILRRARIISMARGESLHEVARAVNVTHEHLRKALSGQRKLSKSLASRLHDYLGEAHWKFALGITNNIEVD